MSNTNEQLVHNKTGKFVTFSEDCDNDKKSLHDKYVEAGIVVPKTRVSANVVDNIFRNDWTPIRFPKPAKIILPFSKKIAERDRQGDKVRLKLYTIFYLSRCSFNVLSRYSRYSKRESFCTNRMSSFNTSIIIFFF